MMGNLFKVFGPSPINPLEKHMQTVHQCAKLLLPFFESVLHEDWEKAQAYQTQINGLEKDADHIKRDLRLNLPTGLFLPFSRTDLLELLHTQDRIANKAQDIAGLIVSRKMHIPEAIQAHFIPFVKRSLDASHQACQAINELDELLETGFRGNEVKIVESMILNLDALEHESDEMLANIQHTIFTLESSLPAIEVFFLYKLVQWVGELADSAQSIGARLLVLIAK